MSQYTEAQHFKGRNFSEEPLPKGEYENCTFHNCSFLNANLTALFFIDCKFEDCDLSMANLNGTAFRDVYFTGCKLVGLRFDYCNPFLLSMNFDSCQLNLSSFYKLNLKNSRFVNCNLQETDFAETDLTNATLQNCDLAGTIFDRTILEKADLRQSYNFTIDPENNRIKKARFSMASIPGLLSKYNISIE